MNNRGKFLVLSFLSLFNIVFLPRFSVWGGLFPSQSDIDFFSDIESIFKSSDAFQSWNEIIFISVLLPIIVMIVGAVLDSKIVFLVGSVAGIVLWIRFAVSYINQYNMDYFMDFKNGSIAIGTWIAAPLFIISAVVAIASPNKKPKPVQAYYRVNPNNNINPYNSSPYNNFYNNNYPFNNPPYGMPGGIGTANHRNVQKTQPAAFCPQCGAKHNPSGRFCGNCGYEFK